MSHFFWAEKAGEGWETMVLIRQEWPHKTGELMLGLCKKVGLKSGVRS